MINSVDDVIDLVEDQWEVDQIEIPPKVAPFRIQSEEYDQPVVGILFYFHIPKNGGTFVANGAKNTPEIEPFWTEEPDAIEAEVMEYVAGLEKSKKLIIFGQHSGCSPMESMEWLPPLRDKVRGMGYFFDIIITLRNPIDYTLSTYNYYTKEGNPGKKFMPESFEEWMTTIANIQTRFIQTGHGSSNGDFYYRPWEDENGAEIPGFSPPEFMEQFDHFLSLMDFIGFTSRMEDFLMYMKHRCNIDFNANRPVNVSPKTVTEADVTPEMIQTFSFNNILDTLLISKANIISKQRIQNYITSGWHFNQTKDLTRREIKFE